MDVSAFTAPATMWSLPPEDLDDNGNVDEELRFSSIDANNCGDLTRMLAAVFDEGDEEENKERKQQPTNGRGGGRAHAKTTDEQNEAPQSVHTDTLPTHDAEMVAAEPRRPDKPGGRSAVVHQAASSSSVPTIERPPTRPTNSSQIQHGTRPAEAVPPLPPTRPMEVGRPAPPAIQHAAQPMAPFRFVQQPPPMRSFQVVQPSTLMIRQEFIQPAPYTQPFLIIQQQIFVEHSPYTQPSPPMALVPPLPPALPSVAASSSSHLPSPPLQPTRPQPPIPPEPSAPAASTRATSASGEQHSAGNFDDVSVFVNGIHVDTQESELRVFFRAYRPIKRVTIVRDHVTKEPLGCAYVMFADSATREDALTMDGKELHGQCVEVKPKLATLKEYSRNPMKSRQRPGPSPSPRSLVEPRRRPHSRSGPLEPSNRHTHAHEVGAICVRNLAKETGEQDLRAIFGAYGEVVDVTFPFGVERQERKTHAFVTFKDAASVESAVDSMKGRDIYGQRVMVDKKKLVGSAAVTPGSRRWRRNQGRHSVDQ